MTWGLRRRFKQYHNHIKEIVSASFPSLRLTVRDTVRRNTERPAEECSSFCGPAHTAGPWVRQQFFTSTEPDLEPNRRREDRQRKVEYEVRLVLTDSQTGRCAKATNLCTYGHRKAGGGVLRGQVVVYFCQWSALRDECVWWEKGRCSKGKQHERGESSRQLWLTRLKVKQG